MQQQKVFISGIHGQTIGEGVLLNSRTDAYEVRIVTGYDGMNAERVGTVAWYPRRVCTVLPPGGYCVRLELLGGYSRGYNAWHATLEAARKDAAEMKQCLAYWKTTGQAHEDERIAIRDEDTREEIGDKVAVTKVEILWSESGLFQRRYRHADKDHPVVLPTLAAANDLLRNMAQDAPGPGCGYDKTAFRITWQDGKTYEGRYDLHHPSAGQENPNGLCDIGNHIWGAVAFMTGEHKPAYMSTERYESCLATYMKSGNVVEEAKAFLANYEL